jgi:hypothetical protein
VVHGSGDCGVEGRATLHAWWPTALLGVLVGAVIALASALAYLVVIPNRPIRSAELGVATPS